MNVKHEEDTGKVPRFYTITWHEFTRICDYFSCDQRGSRIYIYIYIYLGVSSIIHTFHLLLKFILLLVGAKFLFTLGKKLFVARYN